MKLSAQILVLVFINVASPALDSAQEMTCTTKEECDELQEFQDFLKSYQEELEDYQQAENQAWQQYVEQTRREFEDYVANIRGVWGDATAISDKKNWVEYSDNLTSQIKVDFENNQIVIKNIEVNNESDFKKQMRAELKKLLEQTQASANKDNPLKKNINKIAKSASEKQVISKIQQIYSKNSATDDEKVLSSINELLGTDNVEKQVEALVKSASINSEQVTVISFKNLQVASNGPLTMLASNAKTKKKAMVGKIKLAEKWTSIRAKKYKDFVNAFSKEWNINKPLIYSIMYNESSFNPVAISPIPAYGLMQIVPESAGVDVAKRHFKEDVLFSPDFLFEPKNNIAIGVAYLNILNARYFRGIKDPTTRMYCVIAAYNTGPGNVSRALTNTKKLKLAVIAANKLKPEQIYERLLSDLPYDETKNYLKKVASSIKKFENI